MKDLEVRVSEAEKRLDSLEERVDTNEQRSKVRMDVMEQKLEEYRAQVMAEMQHMRQEVRLATGGKVGATTAASKRPATPPPTPRD